MTIYGQNFEDYFEEPEEGPLETSQPIFTTTLPTILKLLQLLK
jgi:hypothetical protein